MLTQYIDNKTNLLEKTAYHFYNENDAQSDCTSSDASGGVTNDANRTPLVLLHGFCEDSTLWDALLPLLQSQINAPILTIDIGSFGESRLHDSTIEGMATQVHNVLATLNIAQSIVFGHSMGGYVALAIAELYPNRLAGIGLLHSHVFEDSDEKKENRNKSIQFIERHGTAPFVRQLFYQLFEADFARSNTELVEHLIKNASKFSAETIVTASKAMRDRPDRSNILKTFGKPVLLISGNQDNTIPTAQSLAQAVYADTTYFIWLKNTGHMSMFEAPETVVAAISDFIDACQ